MNLPVLNTILEIVSLFLINIEDFETLEERPTAGIKK